MTAETNFQARFEAMRAKAEAAGVKIVSEEQLRARWQQRQERRAAAVKSPACKSNTRRPAAAEISKPRMPYRDDEADQAVTAKDFSQRDFEASGAASSANDLLVAWFRQPKNFGKWFTKKFLEDEVMQGKSGCCNNRAKDCRDYFISGGLYIDNQMIEVDGRLQSHYALVRIEDAVSLSNQQKQKFLTTD
jgi:hypothetical protein